jgi:hypothetical protein
MRRTTLSLLVLLMSAASFVSGCDTDAPEPEEKYNRYQLLSVYDDAEADDTLLSGLISLIEDADYRIWVAFEDLTEVAVADALIDALDRGVDVRVVADWDAAEQAGTQRLLEEFTPFLRASDFETEPVDPPLFYQLADQSSIESASLPKSGDIRFAGGPTVHTPQPGTDICRSASLNGMSHNFMVIDQTTVMNLSGGFPESWRDKHQTGFIASSEDLAQDFADEFRQIMTGVDATTPSAFNGPLKSITDGRFIYPGTIAEFELYFGPQERTSKRVIDHIFGAKSSVWIATEQLSNDFVCKALIYKMRTAFDVRLVLKEPIDPETLAENSSCSELIDEFAADNPVGQGYRQEVRYESDLAANLIIIDEEEGRVERADQTLAYVMSQPLLTALTFGQKECNQETYQDSLPFDPSICGECPQTGARVPTALPADTFTDANVWLVREFRGHSEPAVDQLANTFRTIFEGADQ